MYPQVTALRPSVLPARALLAAGLIAMLLATLVAAPNARAATTLNVGVGAGTGTTSANAYLPGDVTILMNDSVKFTIESDEPHSVTFGNGPAGTPPDEWPQAGLTGTIPPPPGTATLTGAYNGTGFVNTTVIFKGSTATVQFTAAGTFPFICVIHPGMAGNVNVVASGTTTTQAEADAKATQTRTAILAMESSLEASAEAAVSETKRSDGTSLWNIFTSVKSDIAPQPGGGTGYLELLRFIPPNLEIEEGDTVRWTAPSVHTVTFLADGQDPSSVDPFGTPPTGGSTYDGSSLYHSGLLGIPAPGAPSTYELTFPDAGTFGYICALHVFLGQTGQIQVASAPAVTPPATDLGSTSSGPPDSSAPWLALALLALLSTTMALGFRLARRH
jgi:plastocyanin